MGKNSAIKWTDYTFNPWAGCAKVSPGCANCYMFTEQKRYGRDPHQIVRTKTWGNPIKWQREAEAEGRIRLVFTCSWSDWFISEADEWRPEAWDLIRRTSNLHYQILTKRPERILDHLPADWGDGYPNVWLGVSVENRKHGLPRIDLLRQVPARIRFLSVEPLLEDVGSINLDGIHWVIVGGESGHTRRPMEASWVRSIRDQCAEAGIPFFFKQWGGVRPESNGRTLDGRTWDEFPVSRAILAAS